MKLNYTYLDFPNGGIELGLTKEDVEYICVSGSNDLQTEEVCKKEYVKKQFKDYCDAVLISGADYLCDHPDLKNREHAITYLVWMAAWNIYEDGFE